MIKKDYRKFCNRLMTDIFLILEDSKKADINKTTDKIFHKIMYNMADTPVMEVMDYLVMYALIDKVKTDENGL